MSGCEKCKSFARELKREQSRSAVLTNALQTIYGVAKENMWYPCSFEDHEKVDAAQEAWHVADVNATKYEGYDK